MAQRCFIKLVAPHDLQFVVEQLTHLLGCGQAHHAPRPRPVRQFNGGEHMIGVLFAVDCKGGVRSIEIAGQAQVAECAGA